MAFQERPATAGAEAALPAEPGRPLKYLLPPGDVRPSPALRHHVCMHIGGPAATRRSLDGKTQQRIQQAGDFDVIPLGMAGHWRNEGAIELLLIEIEQDFADRIGDQDVSGRGIGPGLKIRDPHLRQLALALMADNSASQGAARLYRESVMTALVARLMVLQSEGAPAEDAGRDRFTFIQQRRLAEFIEANLADDLSLAALADLAGYGLSRFKTLFRNSFGCTPHAYVLQRRVDRAKRLIEDGALPLSQIALEAGFSHQSHMAGAFSRFLGITPGALRRLSQ